MFEKDEFSLTLTMRQLSLFFAGLLLFCFFVFIGGYFLGQKKATEEFTHQIDQESLADQIYSSMCIMNDTKDEAEDVPENGTDEAEISESTENKEEITTAPSTATDMASSKKVYKATIAGFSAQHMEDGKKLVSRLTFHGYPCELVEKFSRTPKGKTVVWYQVMTKPYDSLDQLEKAKPFIAKVAYVKEKSISISECA